MREIIFDVETTGLHHNAGDRIIEIGAVEVINFMPTGETLQAYVNPGRSVSEDTIRITGITDADLDGKPPFESPEIVDRLLNFIGDAQIVAHNARFDRGFLNMELERCGRAPIPENRWVDSAAMAREKFPGAAASLDALCKRFNVNSDARTFHGALLDSQLLAEVYLELNGGRHRAFEFGRSRHGQADSDFGSGRARQRPQPLKSLLTDEEKARHEAFTREIGAAEKWGYA